jgi:hypothetical protein
MNYKNRQIIDELQEWNRIICLYYDVIVIRVILWRYYFTFKDSCISPNCSKADSRFSTISPAIISGAGRFSESSRV